jgi:hypothetical protein
VKQILISLLILTGLPASALAQASLDSLGNFTFDYFVNGVPSVTPTGPYGFIQFPNTNAGAKSTISFLTTANSQTQANYTLTNATISGAGFSLPSTQTSVPIGGTGTLQIVFSPTTANPAQTTGTLNFQLVGSTGLIFNVYITIFANVLQPQFILAYIDPASGNQLALSQGGILQFPKTTVNTTAVAKIVVMNNGTGSGTVDSISVSGAGYTLTNAPLTPATVLAGSSFTVGVTFSPTAILEYKGTAVISISGVTTTFNLDGQGTNFAYTYTLLSASGNTALQPGGTITLPATLAGGVSKNSVTIQVQNTGNQAGTISSILALGGDFQLANLPILPDTLNPGDITVFNVVFQPANAGTSTGRLQIGNDLFNLTGSALGSALSLAVDVGLGPVAIANQGIVSLPSTVVGANRLVYIDVTNTGNQPLILNGIGITGAGFTIPTPPGATTLSPSQTMQFTVQYSPVNVATVTGTVTINNQTLTLLGVGQAPPPLPAVTITNVASVLAPLQQPSAGVQFAAVYPYAVRGVLTLSFLSASFVDDPSIEFATGSRTINFTIPANTTQAVFTQASGASLGTLAAFQTGTVAGSVSLTVSGLTVGQVDLTPSSAPSQSFQIPASVPQLTSVLVQSFANNQIVLLINGYSTPRNLSQLSFQFTGASGADLQTTSLNLNVSGAFSSWYTSTASDVFGSQFSVTVTATITGNPAAVQSIAVTATNSKGTSAAQTVTLSTGGQS